MNEYPLRFLNHRADEAVKIQNLQPMQINDISVRFSYLYLTTTGHVSLPCAPCWSCNFSVLDFHSVPLSQTGRPGMRQLSSKVARRRLATSRADKPS